MDRNIGLRSVGEHNARKPLDRPRTRIRDFDPSKLEVREFVGQGAREAQYRVACRAVASGGDDEDRGMSSAKTDRQIAQRQANRRNASHGGGSFDPVRDPNKPLSGTGLLRGLASDDAAVRAGPFEFSGQSRRDRVIADDRKTSDRNRYRLSVRRFGDKEEDLIRVGVDAARFDPHEARAFAFRGPTGRIEACGAAPFRQPDHEIVEHRRGGFDRDHQRTGRAFPGEVGQGSEVGGQPRQPARADDEIEGGVRQRFEIAAERNIRSAAMTDPRALETPRVEVENCQTRAMLSRVTQHFQSRWPCPDLQDAQGEARAPGARDGGEANSKRTRGGERRGRTQFIGRDGAVRRRNERALAQHEPLEHRLDAGGEQQFGSPLGMLRGKRREYDAGLRHILVDDPKRRAGAPQQPALLEASGDRFRPTPLVFRNSPCSDERFEVERPVLRQSTRQQVRRCGRPPIGQNRGGRRRDAFARFWSERHPQAPQRRTPAMLTRRSDPVTHQREAAQTARGARPRDLKASATQRRDQLAGGIEQMKIDVNRPLVAPPDVNGGASEANA